jgi:hypothetical protein
MQALSTEGATALHHLVVAAAFRADGEAARIELDARQLARVFEG